MDVLSCMLNITSLLANIFALVGIPLGVIQIMKSSKANQISKDAFVADATRSIRQATIDFYCMINIETKEVIDEVLIHDRDYTSDEILEDENLHKQIRRYLSLMERLSVGIQAYIYDIQVFDRIQGKSTLIVYEKLKPYLDYIEQQHGHFFMEITRF